MWQMVVTDLWLITSQSTKFKLTTLFTLVLHHYCVSIRIVRKFYLFRTCLWQMRLPSKPYSSLPIYSIGSTNTLPRERISAMASVGQGLSVAGAPGASKPGEAAASPALKEPAKGASKGPKKAPGAATAAAAAKTDKSSSNPQRHSIQKTMSK